MERIDDLKWNGLRLIQDDEQFCFGCDAVELANFALSKPSDRACDLGCGNGIIPVLLAAKSGMRVVGVEIQEKAAILARRNAELNNLTDRIEIVCERMQDFASKRENVGAFTVVTCNPPYRKQGSGSKQQSEAVAVARHEIAVTAAEAIACAARLLSSGGKFFMLSQTERLSEILALCEENRLTPKTLQIFRPCDSKPPHLFMLRCLKDGKGGGLRVLPERNIT